MSKRTDLKGKNNIEDTGPIDLEKIKVLTNTQARQQRLSKKQKRKHEITSAEIKNKPIQLDKLARSFKYAIRGCIYVFKTQPNLKVHTIFACLAIALGIIFHISVPEWLALVLVIGFVIILEFINTAIETLVDLYTEDYSFLAGVSKDVGAATVLVMAVVSVVVGIIIFLPKIIHLFI